MARVADAWIGGVMTECVMVETVMVSVPAKSWKQDWAYGVGYLTGRKISPVVHVTLNGEGPICGVEKRAMQVHDAWGADVTCQKCRAALGRAVKATWQQQEFQLEEAA